MQEILPKNHMRNVRTGNEWSSVVGTVSATSRIGEFSSSSSASSSLLETGVSSVVSHDEDDDADDGFVGSLAFVSRGRTCSDSSMSLFLLLIVLCSFSSSL